MTGNPDPAMFAGDEFLDSPIAFDNVRPIRLLLLLLLRPAAVPVRRWLRLRGAAG